MQEYKNLKWYIEGYKSSHFPCGKAETLFMLTLAYMCFDITWLVVIQNFTILHALSNSILSLHTYMLKSVFNCQCWFRQGSVAIYWGIVGDSVLVKSYFVLWAWSSASSRHVKVEDEAGMPTGDPKSSPIFHPYCPWHIQSGRVPSMERDRKGEGEKSEKLRWTGRSVSRLPPSVLLSRGPNFRCLNNTIRQRSPGARLNKVKLRVPGLLHS